MIGKIKRDFTMICKKKFVPLYVGKTNVLLSVLTNQLMKQTGEYLQGGTFTK